jgi:hypothetical protein
MTPAHTCQPKASARNGIFDALPDQLGSMLGEMGSNGLAPIASGAGAATNILPDTKFEGPTPGAGP